MSSRLEDDVLTDLEALEAELGEGIRDLRTSIDPAFAARMDARVSDGFPAEPSMSGKRRPLLGGRLLPALAAAGSLVIAGGVAIDMVGQDPDPARVAREGAGRSAPSGDASGAAGQRRTEALDSPSIEPLPAPERNLAPGRRDRDVERSASLTLAAPTDEVPEVADRVIEVTDRHRGIVLSSDVSSDARGDARANFDLRIPVSRLRDALRDLSKLASVRARTDAGRDVTGSVVSAEDRLSDLREERRALLRRLASADAPGMRAALRERLRQTRSMIAQVRGELSAIRERTAFATVSVTVEGDPDGAGSSDGGLGGALEDAVDVLESIAGGLLIGLAIASPLILLGLGSIVASRIRRRRRDRALENSP